MREQIRLLLTTRTTPRWTWVVAAGLLLVSAGLTARAVFLHWLPCRGSMLTGWFAGTGPGGEVARACLSRMDAGLPFPYPPEPLEQTPGASEIGAVAMACCALAWLVVVLGLQIPTRWRVLLSAPALPVLIIAAISLRAAGDLTRTEDDYVSGWLVFSPELAMVVVLGLAATRLDLSALEVVKVAVLAWGCAAFALVHEILEYVVMVGVNSWNWDTPPGTGYLTAAVLALCALFVLGTSFGRTAPDPTTGPGDTRTGDQSSATATSPIDFVNEPTLSASPVSRSTV